MTFSSIEIASPTASNAKIDFAAIPKDSGSRTENGEFGQIMSGFMQSCAEAKAMTAGQEVAVSSAVELGFPGSLGGNLGGSMGASLGGDFLKAVNLGPFMNVITSEATVPDEQSLEAFARSQGLDETAVQWLMGSSPVITMAPQMTSLQANAPQTLQTPVVTEAQATQPTSNPDLMDVLKASTPTAASGETGLTESPAQPRAAQDAHTATTPSVGLNENSNTKVSGSKPEMPLLPNALSAAALWAITQATDKARVASPVPEDPSEVAKVQVNLMASTAPAAFWMLRNPLPAVPSKEALTTPSVVALSESEIDLTQAATSELLESLSQALGEGAALNTPAAAGDQPTPLSGHTNHRMELAAAARQDVQNPHASASAQDSGNTQRSENVQNLAEKMGQAVGQRILSEIEKGQWHLKLSLRPATLGHIEVEMRMRSGELDAVFTAPQAMTRELLQEGMSKLKDTLSQMGMDVASMQVGDGQTPKHGGNSTPEQMSKSTKVNSNDTKSGDSSVQATVSRMKMGKDGWDVLV